MPSPADLKALAEATPYLRTALAFVLQLRHPLYSLDDAYSEADKFLVRLREDVAKGVK